MMENTRSTRDASRQFTKWMSDQAPFPCASFSLRDAESAAQTFSAYSRKNASPNVQFFTFQRAKKPFQRAKKPFQGAKNRGFGDSLRGPRKEMIFVRITSQIALVMIDLGAQRT